MDHDALIKLSRRSHGNRVNDAFLRMLETHKAAQRSEPAYVQHLMFPLLGDPVGLGAAWKAAWVLTQMGYTVDIHEVESALWEYEMRVSLRPIAGLA